MAADILLNLTGWSSAVYMYQDCQGCCCASLGLFHICKLFIPMFTLLDSLFRQILCSRLKILAAAQIRVVVPEQDAATVSRENVAVNIIKGHWEVDPSQRHIMPRLR